MLSLLCKDLCVFIVALRGKAETVFTSSLCCKFLCDIVTLWSEVCFLVLFECTSVFSPSFEGFFFHFLLQPIPLIALANRTMPLPALS
ncbi:hypothetical protein EMO44_23540 [Escherichia coli]|nr:hypothetical protein [Escherichia coli]